MKYPRLVYLALPLLTAVAAALIVYFSLEHYLITRAKQEVEDILISNRGFHHYVQRVLHPAIFQDIDSGLISRNFYDPQVMSSSYIVRTLHGFNNEERIKHGLKPMYYKMAALNPRNPVNKADDWESAKIVLFRRDSTIYEQEEIVTIDNQKYLYFAVPFLKNEQRCLKCHGNPTDAPPGLKRMYPLEGGYHEKAGDLRAVESLRIPLESEIVSASVLAVFSGVGIFSIIALLIFNGSLKSNVRQKTRSLENEIAGRKKSAEELSTEKERLAVTLRSIGDAVIAADVAGKTVLMNKVAEELTGWSIAETSEKQLSDIFNIVDEVTHLPQENPVKRVLSSGELIELPEHTLLVSRNGNERLIAGSGAPIKDRESTTVGIVLVFRDTTEKQKLNETLQRTAKLESIGVLAGGIAHDFNNLMGGIYGYIDIATNETDIKKVSGNLSKAMETINRARSLTRQLLTFAKGGAPVRKTTSLIPFIAETAQFALSGSSVACRFDIPENLWPCNIDKNQICQVIDNIMINTQQAMPSGGTIDFSSQNIALDEKSHPALSAGKYVKITIRDHGTGIPKEFLPRIFDPFFTTKPMGHGLGLATCHSIISRHGGAIDVESVLGKGSTFYIYLPAATESVSNAASAPGIHHTGCGTMVVMDDEEVIRNTIAAILESAGYTVIQTVDGKEALEVFLQEMNARHRISGLIVDLTIPGGMGGKDVVNEIRKTDKKTPVFVASGYAEDPIMKNPSEYGFTASICKPFRKSELWEMLNAHLDSGNKNRVI